jgi:indoleamine 2,3-dioxygenase
MRKINERRRLMWQASRWKHYNDFRVFIMGIKGNDEIFGDGVVYEGVSEEPKKYRGQTGAQDNIIPLMDIFSGIINNYPKNELTHYLKDLRSYRPKCIQNFLEDVRLFFTSSNNSILNQIKANKNFRSLEILLELLEEIYLFRNGHWQFVQRYIMQNTVYPKATGGTPIISWIPNQINAVLKTMQECFNNLPKKYVEENIPNWIKEFKIKRSLLDKQLELLSEKNYKAKEVFELNKRMNLNDEKK